MVFERSKALQTVGKWLLEKRNQCKTHRIYLDNPFLIIPITLKSQAVVFTLALQIRDPGLAKNTKQCPGTQVKQKAIYNSHLKKEKPF